MGWCVATIAVMSRLATRGKLTSVQSGQVMISTLKVLGGYSPGIVEHIDRLRREPNPDYILGLKSAEKCVGYVMGLDLMTNDTDLKAATEWAEAATFDGTVGKAAIDAALTHLLFIDVVEKRLTQK